LPPRFQQAGEWVTVSGTWVNIREHGQQFPRPSFLSGPPPRPPQKDRESTLGSGMIPGHRLPIYASRARGGVRRISLFESDSSRPPERLREVRGHRPGAGPGQPGLRPSERFVCAKSWYFLQTAMVCAPPGRPCGIFKTYGNDARCSDGPEKNPSPGCRTFADRASAPLDADRRQAVALKPHALIACGRVF